MLKPIPATGVNSPPLNIAAEPTTLALAQSWFQSQRNHRIWFIGRAGSGKSTLCQYLAWEFANGHLWQERFELVISLPLRKLWLDPMKNYDSVENQASKAARTAISDWWYNINWPYGILEGLLSFKAETDFK